MFDLQLAAAGAELARGRLQAARAAGARGRRGLRRARRARARRSATAYEAEWAPRRRSTARPTSTRRCSTRSRDATAGRGRPRAHAGRARTATSGGCSSAASRAARTRRRASSARWRWRCDSAGTGCARSSPAAPPVLLLDDVFSELDDQRAVALVAHLDAGQTLVTTAGTVPRGDRRRPHAARRRRPRRGGRVSAADRDPGDGCRDRRCRGRWSTPISVGDAAAVVGASSGCPRRPCTAISSAWAEVVGDDVAAHAGSCRCATACSRWPSTTRSGRPSCATWRPTVVERASGLVGAGVGDRRCGSAVERPVTGPENPAKSAAKATGSGGPSGTWSTGISVL